jgi:hypothetical protein
MNRPKYKSPLKSRPHPLKRNKSPPCGGYQSKESLKKSSLQYQPSISNDSDSVSNWQQNHLNEVVNELILQQQTFQSSD